MPIFKTNKRCADCGTPFGRTGRICPRRCEACDRAAIALQASAANHVQRALKRGTLVRQNCEVCGRAPVEAHHDDYSKPLAVRWLCRRHHQLAHGEIRRAAAKLRDLQGEASPCG